MKMKRVLSLFLAFLLCLSTCVSFSFAAEDSLLRSSPTLARYNAMITKGSSSGNIIISYDVLANIEAESVGVSSIKIYKSNMSYVTTIIGTAENGLIATDTDSHRSSYTYHGISGTYYYAEVTVTATINGVTDSRTITTNTLKAP